MTHAQADTTAVLIGDAASLAALRAQLGVVEAGLKAIGEVVIEPGDPQGATASVDAVCRRLGPGVAVVSLPASAGRAIAAVRTAVRGVGVSERFVPPLAELLASPPAPSFVSAGNGPVEMDLASLIGRAPRPADETALRGLISGRRVLVTGAGGSIGSELAKLCASYGPEAILLVERSENGLFEIDRGIAQRWPDLPRRAVLHDIVDDARTKALFTELRPQVVFHAAAHKHVPLMEDHPAHAVTNNLFGTKSVLDASVHAGAERFVLISSDKAVNPTSVMGATKRLAELYVLGRDRAGELGATKACMVRFGNVLGSACSVLPIWSAQLREGAAMTVTDARMTRYFMTIPEAAALVAQSAAMAGDEPSAPVYVLDMGEPVRILDLASRFATAHGLRPVVRGDAVRGEDDPRMGDESVAEIVLTGARPGEKQHEELAYAAELLRPTRHPAVRAMLSPSAPEAARVAEMVAAMDGARSADDASAVIAAIAQYVPEWRGARPRGGAAVQADPKPTGTPAGTNTGANAPAPSPSSSAAA